MENKLKKNENSVTDKDINSDFLSQSYSQGIERITGTKDHIVNFQVPKEVLENRKKTWNNLFDKYSEEMSDDIELNVDTLEPEEKEDEECNEEEYSCGERVPMRKPAIMVQYWIDTGNTPYKIFLDKKELSEPGSSLSEEEIISPSYSLFSNEINESNNKHENDSSFSSVDTAAYILSNANVTKKADIIAIIKGAKSNGIKSSKDNYIKNAKTAYNDTNCIENVATDHLMHNESRDNVSYISHSTSIENVTSNTNNQLVTGTAISANTVQPDVSSQNLSCDTVNKPDVLNANPKNVDVRNIIDIVNIFQQFNETSKRLSIDDKSGTVDGNKVLKEHSSSQKQMSANMEETVSKDANLVSSFHRKKLYTGRNSPVDLISMEKDNSDTNKSKSPKTILSLHPALYDSSIRSKSPVHKEKGKRHSSSKKINSSKKVETKKGQKHSSVSSKKITVRTSKSALDPTVDSSLQNLSGSPNNIDKRSSDNLIRDLSNDINVSKKNVAQKYPVVYLERITCLKGKNSKSIKNKDITQESSASNDLIASRLRAYEVENLESVDSDQSTILICECNNAASQDASSVSSSFYLRLSTENGSSVTDAEMNGKLKKTDMNHNKNLKNTDMNHNKKALVILEQLPQSIIERYTKATQVLSMDGDHSTSSEKLRNKSKKNSSKSQGTNIKNDAKFREIKVTLERLPVDTYLKKINSATNINFPTVKDNISQGTNNNKKKSANTIESSNDENKKIARAIHKTNNNYSLRIRTRSKNDDEIKTSDDAAHNQAFSGTESNFTSRYRNHDSQVPQNKRRKLLVLDFISSDEDDLVRLIQPSEKRLKTLVDTTSKARIAEKDLYDEAILVRTNKDQCDSNTNISTTICSSKQDNLRKINGSIKERNRQNENEVKFFNSNTTSVDSFPKYKHKLSFFPRRSNQYDSTMKNLNGRRERYLFSNTNNISNNSEKHLKKATKENRINRRNDTCVTLFQTKIFNTESSDSDSVDKSNNNVMSIRKSLRIASTHDREQFNANANKEKLCSDSHTKMHVNKQSNSLDISTEKYDTANKTHSAKMRLRSATGMAVKSNERSDKESNNNINSITTTKTILHLPVASNTQNTLAQKDNTILNASLRNSNSDKLLRNKQIPQKFNLKNSPANQQRGVKSMVNRLLTFQTKSYYDSDSSDYW